MFPANGLARRGLARLDRRVGRRRVARTERLAVDAAGVVFADDFHQVDHLLDAGGRPGDADGNLGFAVVDDAHQVHDGAFGDDLDVVGRNLVRVDQPGLDLGVDEGVGAAAAERGDRADAQLVVNLADAVNHSYLVFDGRLGFVIRHFAGDQHATVV